MSCHRTVLCLTMCLMFICSFSGCATIVSGRRYPVTVDNSGGSTYFSVMDSENRIVHSGVTPQQVTLKSTSGPFKPARYSVYYAGQDGARKHDLEASLNWWTAGNIVIGGLPGIAVDAATGAMWRLQPRITGGIPSAMVVADTVQGAALVADCSGQATGPGFTDAASEKQIQQASFGKLKRRPVLNG